MGAWLEAKSKACWFSDLSFFLSILSFFLSFLLSFVRSFLHLFFVPFLLSFFLSFYPFFFFFFPFFFRSFFISLFNNFFLSIFLMFEVSLFFLLKLFSAKGKEKKNEKTFWSGKRRRSSGGKKLGNARRSFCLHHSLLLTLARIFPAPPFQPTPQSFSPFSLTLDYYL